MSTKQKCYQNWNVTKTENISDLRGYQTEMSPILKCHNDLTLTRTEISQTLKFCPIGKCHQNLNIPKIKILPNLKVH